MLEDVVPLAVGRAVAVTVGGAVGFRDAVAVGDAVAVPLPLLASNSDSKLSLISLHGIAAART